MSTSTAEGFGDGTAAPPLVVSSYTWSTEVGFEDRVRAAAAAGYEGIGLRAENYWDAQSAGLDDDAMREIAAEHGVPILEVEYITAWGTGEDRNQAQQDKERAVFHMARAFGVHHLNTGLLEKLPLDVVTEAFGELCDRAGGDLTRSGVHALQRCSGPGHSLANTRRRRTGQQCPDRRRLALGPRRHDPGRPRPYPPTASSRLQLCDVLEHPIQPPRAESLGHRLPPGQGWGDAVGVVRALRDKGAQPGSSPPK